MAPPAFGSSVCGLAPLGDLARSVAVTRGMQQHMLVGSRPSGSPSVSPLLPRVVYELIQHTVHTWQAPSALTLMLAMALYGRITEANPSLAGNPSLPLMLSSAAALFHFVPWRLSGVVGGSLQEATAPGGLLLRMGAGERVRHPATAAASASSSAISPSASFLVLRARVLQFFAADDFPCQAVMLALRDAAEVSAHVAPFGIGCPRPCAVWRGIFRAFGVEGLIGVAANAYASLGGTQA